MDYVFIDHCRISDMNSVLLSHLVTSRYALYVKCYSVMLCSLLPCHAMYIVQVHLSPTYHDELFAVPKYNITVLELTIVFSSYDE